FCLKGLSRIRIQSWMDLPEAAQRVSETERRTVSPISLRLRRALAGGFSISDCPAISAQPSPGYAHLGNHRDFRTRRDGGGGVAHRHPLGDERILRFRA